jgi:streptomycin 6-kinase
VAPRHRSRGEQRGNGRLITLPAGLDWWRTRPDGAEWLASLPGHVAELAERWSLAIGEPFEPARISLVLSATRADGAEAVLKLNFPEAESAHEGDALAWWAGAGAARLLELDRDRAAVLLERLRPGTQLWSLPEEEALLVAADVLRRLRRPAPAAGPFRPLAGEAERWATEVPRRWAMLGRPCDRRVIDEATAAIGELVPSQPELVVVHQDLHGGNVLRSDERGWLAIDPKPLVGEPAFDVASLVRDRRWELTTEARPVERIRRRLDVLSSELGLERERMRGWALVHALAWGLDEDGFSADLVACAGWIAAAA